MKAGKRTHNEVHKNTSKHEDTVHRQGD